MSTNCKLLYQQKKNWQIFLLTKAFPLSSAIVSEEELEYENYIWSFENIKK